MLTINVNEYIITGKTLLWGKRNISYQMIKEEEEDMTTDRFFFDYLRKITPKNSFMGWDGVVGWLVEQTCDVEMVRVWSLAMPFSCHMYCLNV